MGNHRIRVFIGEPTSIDPCRGSEHDGALVLRFLCDPLIDFTPDTGKPMPAAAESWQIEDDGRTVRFFLRKGVRFHHGREVLAEDYVYSWNRLVSPQTDSELAYHLSRIVGFESVRAGIAKSLEGVQAVGTHELVVRMTEPFADIPALFGHHATAPVPREIVEKDPDAFREMPVSNGPYQLAEPWAHNRYILLKRFLGYYANNQAFEAGGRGFVEEIEFRIYEELEDAYLDWKQGKLDITKVPPARIHEAMKLGEKFRATPCALLQYLGFPTHMAPFNQLIVRQAIALGLDRQSIIDKAFAGTRPVATGILPPAIGAAFQKDMSPLLSGPADPEKARYLLRKAGLPRPFRVPFYYNGGLGHDFWVREVQTQFLENLGIELDLRPLPWANFLDRLQKGIDGLFRMTWAIDCPSPDNVLFPLFHSDSIGSDNFSRFSNQEFDEKIKEARGTLDTEKRIRLYQEAERIVLEHMPILPLWFGVQYHVVALDRIKFLGSTVVDIFGEPVLRHAQIRE